jgi:hypothetical protein
MGQAGLRRMSLEFGTDLSRSERRIAEKSYMSANRPRAGPGHGSQARFTAKLTEAAYTVALRLRRTCGSRKEWSGPARRCTRRWWPRATKASWPSTWLRPTGQDAECHRGGRSSQRARASRRVGKAQVVKRATFFRNSESRAPEREARYLTQELKSRGGRAVRFSG